MHSLVDGVHNLRDGTPLLLRPVACGDQDQLAQLVTELSPEDRRWRFHGAVNGLTQSRLKSMTEPADDSLAFVATVAETLIADVRYTIDQTGSAAEFALMVAATWRRRGVASLCIATLAQAAAQRRLRWLYGTVMADNLPMLGLLQRAGFHCSPKRNDDRLMIAEQLVAR